MQFNLGEPASHIVKLSKVLTFPPTQPVNAISFDGHVGLHRNLSKCDPPRTVRLKVKGHPRKLKLLRDDERSCSCKRKDMGRAALLQRTAGWQFAVDPDSRRVLGAVEHLQNECNADKITLLKPVMNMQNVTANLLIHDDMCHFESFAKKHHAKLVSGIRHFVVDAFHCPNHTCQKQVWTAAEKKRCRNVRTNVLKALTPGSAGSIMLNFFVNNPRPLSHRFWLEEMCRFYNDNLQSVPIRIRKRTKAAPARC